MRRPRDQAQRKHSFLPVMRKDWRPLGRLCLPRAVRAHHVLLTTLLRGHFAPGLFCDTPVNRRNSQCPSGTSVPPHLITTKSHVPRQHCDEKPVSVIVLAVLAFRETHRVNRTGHMTTICLQGPCKETRTESCTQDVTVKRSTSHVVYRTEPRARTWLFSRERQFLPVQCCW